MTLYHSKCRKWTNGDGEEISIIPFLSKLYSDDLSKDLSRRYNIYHCPKDGVSSSLGSSGLESFVCDLFRICEIAGEFIGFEARELDKFTNISGDIGYPQRLLAGGHLRSRLVNGKEVLFPTEKLLKNQKVKKSHFQRINS